MGCISCKSQLVQLYNFGVHKLFLCDKVQDLLIKKCVNCNLVQLENVKHTPADIISSMINNPNESHAYLPYILEKATYEMFTANTPVYLTLHTLNALAKQAGYYFVDVKFTQERMLPTLTKTKEEASGRLKQMLASEQKLSFHDTATYERYWPIIQKRMKILSELINTQYDMGAKIFGYQPTCYGNAMLQSCPNILECMSGYVAHNLSLGGPSSRGLSTEYMGLPLIHTSNLYKNKPDYLLNLDPLGRLPSYEDISLICASGLIL